jgi:hypothetical protein
MWCLRPQQDARFVAAMEDVLSVYARPLDAKRPLVCLDEAAKQLLGQVHPVVQATSHHPERVDHHYARNGTCALFMLFAPLLAERHVLVKERRTALDYADVVRFLCEELYPEAEQIVLVQDNLNTHGPWSLYEAFEPEKARRLCQRIEWHYTPKHGSWLNMAELELSVLARQCLQERMESQENLARQVKAWQNRRNATANCVNWHFTTQDARTKLRRLYPQMLRG